MELQVKNLTKYYGKTLALDHLSVTLTEGVHGILGPNGAGKSTWMNLLTDNIRRTEGEILLDGTEDGSTGVWWAICRSSRACMSR